MCADDNKQGVERGEYPLLGHLILRKVASISMQESAHKEDQYEPHKFDELVC